MNVKNVMSIAEIVESEDSYKDTELTFEHATGSILYGALSIYLPPIEHRTNFVEQLVN